MNKKLFFLLLIPALLLIGLYVYTRYSLQAAVKHDREKFSTEKKKTVTSSIKQTSPLDLRPLFVERLQQIVANSSNNIYHLSIGKMTVDVLSSTALFQNVVLKPDRQRADYLQNQGLAPNEIFALSFEKLEVTGINLDDAITQKTMDYKLVKLTNPVFEIYRNGEDTEEIQEDFTHRFLKQMKRLSVQNLVVEGGRVIVHNKGKVKLLKDVAINMNDILIDSGTRNDKNRFLFANKTKLSFKGYETTTGKDQYSLSIAKVNVVAHEQKLTLSGLSFSSPFSKKQFSRRQKFAKELFRFTIPSITLHGVNWWRLINEEEMVAKEVNLRGGKVHVFLDRSLPPKSKMGSFPMQLLMKLPVKINIGRLRANNVDLAYEEYNPVSEQSGIIHMNNISMDIAHVSNLKQRKARPVTVDARALFMNKIPIKADFVFNRTNYKSGGFTARIKSDKDFDGNLVNSFSMPMGLVKIEKGMLQKLHANLKGDELQASGDVFLLYSDLKLFLLEKDKGEEELDKKGVTSFFANTFVLKKDNPKKGDEPRKEQAAFKRIPEGGFFMLVWKTMLTGALKTIGAPPGIANKTVIAPR